MTLDKLKHFDVMIKLSSNYFYLYFTKLQRKKLKRHIEGEKDEETGGGDMAWNSNEQSSRTLLQSKSHTQVEIKKKTFVGMLNIYRLQTVTLIFNTVCYPA